MKSVHYLYLVPIVGVFVLLSSCNDRTENVDLCGIWKLVSVQTLLDGAVDDNDEEGKMEGNALYVFNQDSTYQISEAGYTVSGNWSYSDSMVTFLPSDSTSLSEQVKLERLFDDTLVLSSESNSDYGTIKENLILAKVKK